MPFNPRELDVDESFEAENWTRVGIPEDRARRLHRCCVLWDRYVEEAAVSLKNEPHLDTLLVALGMIRDHLKEGLLTSEECALLLDQAVDWGHQLGKLADLRKTTGEFVVVVNILDEVELNARHRREHAQYLVTHADVYGRATRTALVLRTAIGRGIATAIDWLLPEGKGQAYFATVEDAEAWARQGLRGRR